MALLYKHINQHGCEWNVFLYHRSTTHVGQASSLMRFREHTQLHTHTTVGKTPPDEWLSLRRGHYRTAHKTLTRDKHVPGGIRTRSPSKPVAADARLRPGDLRDRQRELIPSIKQVILPSINTAPKKETKKLSNCSLILNKMHRPTFRTRNVSQFFTCHVPKY